ncbi:MAG: hypothetical protein MJK14_26425, partial [Rivularia sp. ALOHA_DT_140]|nr:hypothetical protein [Rivularia sp. ALOHA_DT_140]
MQKENQQRNPVLLVHGIWDTGKVFRRMTAYLKEGGWEVYDLDLNPNDGSRVQGVTIEVKNSHSKEYMQ